MRGVQFVLIGLSIICWKTFVLKTTKMLSTIKLKSSSEYLLFELEPGFVLTNKVPRDLGLNICIFNFSFIFCK